MSRGADGAGVLPAALRAGRDVALRVRLQARADGAGRAQGLTLKGAWVRRRWAPGRRPMWLLGDGPQKASVDEPALVPIIELHDRMLERRQTSGPLRRAKVRVSCGASQWRIGVLQAWGLQLDPGSTSAEAGSRAGCTTRHGSAPIWQGPARRAVGRVVNPGQKALQEIGRTLALGRLNDLAYAVAIGDRDTGGLDFAAILTAWRRLQRRVQRLDAAFDGGGGRWWRRRLRRRIATGRLIRPID